MRHAESKSRWRALGTALLSSLVLFGLAATLEAKPDQKDSELPPYKVQAFGMDLRAPSPVKVVAPQLSYQWEGMKIRMTFKVGKNGQPYDIRHNGSPFDVDECSLGSIMKSCLTYWKFTPSMDNDGNAVAVKVALPVKVVEPGNGNADSYAGIVLDDPILLAVLDR
jgi:hypothetical protein